MKICPNCGWENDDDFNFCLGCGSQLPEEDAAPAAPAPVPAPPVTAVPATAAPSVQIEPSAPQGGPPICWNCKAEVPQGNMFCGQCGSRMDAAPEASAAPTAPTAPPAAPEPSSPARLVLLLPNGQEGGSYPLKPDKTEIGRTKGNILFLDDPYVSPLHATFHANNGSLIVRDEGSYNGLFLRLTKRIEIAHKDVLLLGKQLLRFEVLEGPAHETFDPSDPNVTPVWGSPYKPYWGRIVQLVSGGSEGNAILLGGDAVELGRERGQITFPGDRFISSIHARLSHENGSFFIEDLGSRNGTFICLRDEHTLLHNDILIIGEQLLRVELRS